MGLGICAMHYSGMSAIQVLPVITYEPGLLLASGAIAIVASFAALWLFFRLRNGRSRQMRLARLGAAVVMGLAISGMHYTGMAAARFAPGAYCTGGSTPDNKWLAITIAVIALAVLTITTILLIYEAHLDSKTRKHNQQLSQANEQLEEVNAQLQHAAMHDALSGLPNRLLLADRLSQAIAHAERHQNRFAVLVVDLDRFKAINDSLGHLAGDAMLKEVARRLALVLRKADTLARLGGDEFVLILNEISGPEDVQAIAGRVLADISPPGEVGRARVAYFREHRHQPLSGRRDQCGDFATTRRCGDVSREEEWPRCLPALRARDECLRERAARARKRTATRPRAARVRPLLPAEGGRERGWGRQRRGPRFVGNTRPAD